MKSVQAVVLVGRNEARACGRVSTQPGAHVDTQKCCKEEGRESPTEKVRKEDLSGQFCTHPGSHPNPLPSFLSKAWGGFPVPIIWMMTTSRQEVGSEYGSFYLLERHGDSIEKTQWPFLSPLQTCGMIGGDASQVLTWLQKNNNLRFPSVDGKSVNMSPSMGQPVLK